MIKTVEKVESMIERLKKIRKITGMSQEQMAREIGVAVQTCHNWVNSKTLPKSLAQINALESFISKYSYLKN